MRKNRWMRVIGLGLVLAFSLAPYAASAFDPDAPGNGMVPTPPPVAPAPGTAAPAPALPGGALPPATNPEPVINAKPVSMFITADELAHINEAIATFKRNRDNKGANAESQAKNFLNQLDQTAVPAAPAAPPKPQPFTYPQFFLQSLSYQNPDDWLVIVNGQKFIPHYDDPASWLKVVMVDKESVVMEWHPQNMEKVSDSWMVAPVGPGQSDVIVDSIHETVTFTLKPNQTFSSYAMRIVEGKVPPVTVMVQPSIPVIPSALKKSAPKAEIPVPAAAAPAPAAPAAKAAEPENTKAGAPGLNDTYKKLGLE